jgi:hypothetical protein
MVSDDPKSSEPTAVPPAGPGNPPISDSGTHRNGSVQEDKATEVAVAEQQPKTSLWRSIARLSRGFNRMPGSRAPAALPSGRGSFEGSDTTGPNAAFREAQPAATKPDTKGRLGTGLWSRALFLCRGLVLKYLKSRAPDIVTKEVLELRGIRGTGTTLQVVQRSTARIAVELYDAPKTGIWKQIVGLSKDLVPILAAIATIIVSIYVYRLNERQVETTERDLKLKLLSDLAEKEEEKKLMGAIKVADIGEKALPIVKQVLSMDNDNLRRGGVLAVVQMRNAGRISRSELFKELTSYSQAENTALRLGAVECFLEMDRQGQLSNQERQRIFALLKGILSPEQKLCISEDGRVVLGSTKFLRVWSLSQPEDTTMDVVRFLVALGKNCPYVGTSDVRTDVVNSMPEIAKHISDKQNRVEIIDGLGTLKQGAPSDLAGHIEELKKVILGL